MLAQILCCLPAFGQAAQDTDDTVAILEVGAATNWNFNGGAATFAPNLAAECTPMENWLELEAGVSPFYTRNSTEWDTDFLFKKPWTLSKKAEFMVGVGPQMGSPETEQENDRRFLGRVGRRLHVLADRKAPSWVVPGASL
jgi:hypothetical protein